MYILQVISLIVAVVLMGCQHKGVEARQGMSPRQADYLLSNLDRATILDYCGPAQKSRVSPGKSRVNPGLDPNSFLVYPFAYFRFEDGGSPLMGVSVHVPGKENVWENAHRESTSNNKMMRVTHQNIVKLDEWMASLDNTSIYELEGKKALKIMEDTPCLTALLTKY
jgi:hypothetical protein